MTQAYFTLSTLALSALLATPLAHAATPDEPALQSYSLDFELKAMTDRRNRGVSDSYNQPALELTLNAAHESGWVGLLQFGTVSQTLFANGSGNQITAALGYRRGDPDGFHYGLGLAQEWFPGAHAQAPTGVDWVTTMGTGVPTYTGQWDTAMDTSYLVLEFGWGQLEARYLYVLSPDFRGSNTATLCGSTYLEAALTSGEAAAAMDCYGDGPQRSGGSHLLDLDYTHRLSGQTKLVAHLGYQSVKNFSGLSGWDYRLGVTHTRWGLDFSADLVGATLGNRDFTNVADSQGAKRRIDGNTVVLGIAKRF